MNLIEGEMEFFITLWKGLKWLIVVGYRATNSVIEFKLKFDSDQLFSLPDNGM